VILLFASPSLSCRLFALFKMVKMAFKKFYQEIEHPQNLNMRNIAKQHEIFLLTSPQR